MHYTSSLSKLQVSRHKALFAWLAAALIACICLGVYTLQQANATPQNGREPSAPGVVSPEIAPNEQGIFDVIVTFKAPEITDDQRAAYMGVLAQNNLVGSQDPFNAFDATSLDEQLAVSQGASQAGAGLNSREAYVAGLEVNAILAQHKARALLSGIEGVSFTSYWITNSMHVTATQEALDSLAALAEVTAISPNRTVTYDEPVAAKKRSKRSALGLDEQKEIEANLKAIRADKVWQDLGITGKGVLIGIVDQGVDVSHPALIKHYAGYNAEKDSLDTSKTSFDALQDGRGMQEGHGTHVAGILVGSQDLGAGTSAGASSDATAESEGENGSADSGTAVQHLNRTGVAPGATFINARAFREGIGATNEDVIAACQWIMAPGGDSARAPRVVNHSWTDGSNKVDPWFDEMAQSMRDAGIFNVMSSGNNGSIKAEPGSVDNPAGSPLLFTVGATTNEGKLTSFSRRGPSAVPGATIKPDVVAPGYQVRSTVAGGGYAAWNGTSMAAPHVAATAALMLEANPSLTVDQIESIIKETARPLTDADYPETPNQGYGHGMVDAYAAVTKALELAGKIPAVTHAALSGHVTTTHAGSANLADETGVVNVALPQTAFIDRAIPVRATVERPEKVHELKLVVVNDAGEALEGIDPIMLITKSDQSTIFEGVIPDTVAQGEALHVKAVITTIQGKTYEAAPATISLVQAVVPGAFSTDLETLIPGFATKGDFKQSEANLQLDPKPQSGSMLIGLNPGVAHMGNASVSTLQLPRIDLTGEAVQAADAKPELVFMEYAEWNKGILGMQLEVYPSKENKNVFNYETSYKTNGWVERRVDLSPFKGMIVDPFIFNLNQNGIAEGYGLYIDNVRVELNGVTAGGVELADQLVTEFTAVATDEGASQDGGTKTGVIASLTLEGTGITVSSQAPDGSYRFDQVPQGDYQLLVSAPGYEGKRVPVSITGDDVTLDVELTARAADEDSAHDEGTNDLEPGNPGTGMTEYALDHNNPLGGALFTSRVMDGAAVAVDPTSAGALDHVMVYVVGNNPASKNGKALLALKKVNTAGRLIDLVKPQEVTLKRGAWNRIDLASHQIALNSGERVYVIVQSLLPKGEGPAVGIDASVRPGTSNYAKGFYYNGEFASLKARGYFGVPMIRAYAADASENAAQDPANPSFDESINTEPVLEIITEEGQAPQDLITVGDWTISPSRGMIVKYNALDEFMKKDLTDRVLEIPSEIGGVKITSIGADAMSIDSGRGDVTRVVIPEGVTEVNEGAFQFLGMRELVLPSTLERIYGGAFQAARISELTIPNGVTYIGDNAFEGVNNLKELVVPDSVEELGRASFKGASSLTKLVLPNNPAFTDIPAGGFANTFALTEVEIPASVTRIKASAFDSSSLEKVVLHEGLKYIDDSAFAGTETLHTVDLPDSVVEIGSDAFKDGKLSGIRLPASLEKIGNGAFKKNKITQVILGDKVSFVDWDAFANNPLELVRLNKTIAPRVGFGKKVGLDGEAFGTSAAVLEVYSMDQVSEDLKKNLVDNGDPQTEIRVIDESAKELVTLTTDDKTVAVQGEKQHLNGAVKLVFEPLAAPAGALSESTTTPGSAAIAPESLAHLKASASTPDAQVIKAGTLKLYNEAGEEVAPTGPLSVVVLAPEGFNDHQAAPRLQAGNLDVVYRVGDQAWTATGAALEQGSFALNITRLPELALVYTPLFTDKPIDAASVRYGWLPADPFADVPADAETPEEPSETPDEDAETPEEPSETPEDETPGIETSGSDTSSTTPAALGAATQGTQIPRTADTSALLVVSAGALGALLVGSGTLIMRRRFGQES